jgi:hypothetical protein
MLEESSSSIEGDRAMTRGNASLRGVALAILFLLGACAGNPLFSTPKNYHAYIASLSLDRFSVAEATAILVRDGFRCEIESDGPGRHVLCTHPTPGSIAFVSLRADVKNPSACVVEEGYAITVV